MSKRDLPLIPDIEVPAEEALIETMKLIGNARQIYANSSYLAVSAARSADSVIDAGYLYCEKRVKELGF